MADSEIQASSIGNTFPPIKVESLHDKGNDRIKGFYTISIEETDQLSKAFSDLIILKDFLQASKVAEPSRITARFFVNKNVDIPTNLRDDIEAQIGLEGEFSEYNLVYVGRNFNGRRASSEVLELQRLEADRIERAVQFSGSCSLELIKQRDVVIKTVKPSSNEQEFKCFAREVLELYQKSFFGDYAFPMNLESVMALLRRDTNIVRVVQERRTGKLCSIGVGETVKIPISFNGTNREFYMAEISDAATLKEYKGRHYYSAIAAEITCDLLKAGVDLLYGEARSASPQVMTVCKKTGRQLARDLHGRPAILHRHCIISGAKDERLNDADQNEKYKGLENLTLWYATRNQLMSLYAPNGNN